MMSKRRRKAVVAELYEQRHFDLLVHAIHDSRMALENQGKDFPSESDSALESILFFVQKHLEFLDKFGVDAEPQYDEEGTFHSRYDAFLTVWLELNACGLTEAAVQLLQGKGRGATS